MKHIGGNDHITLVCRKALQARSGINVEQGILEEAEIEADACLAEKDLGHVGEDILRANILEDGHNARSRTARSGAHLERSPTGVTNQLVYGRPCVRILLNLY